MSDPQAEAARGPQLITVHGTFAGHEDAQGDRWWQIGSPFMQSLAERLDLDGAQVEHAPHQWGDGPNHETKRRDAAEGLFRALIKSEKTGRRYYLIGHSHGGSVIHNALLRAARAGENLEHMIGWCTVGTPFMDYAAHRRLYQRVGQKGLTVFTTGVFSFIAALVFLVLGVLDDDATSAGESLTFAGIMLLYAAICLIGLRAWTRRQGGWFDAKQKAALDDRFGDRWLGLWHAEDEAIAALNNIQEIDGPLVPHTFLRPAIMLIQVVVVSIIGVVLIAMAWELHALGDASAGFSAVIFVVFILGLAVMLVAVWLISWVLRFLVYQVGKPLSRRINRIVWRSVRERAWGDDILPESVNSVEPQPPYFKRRFEPLPELVAAPLRDHSDRSAISTLNKVRKLLGMSQHDRAQSNIHGELMKSLQWDELIHTSYFGAPAFVDLLALGMARAGVGETRDGFSLTGRDREELSGWLARNPVVKSRG